MDFQNFPKTPIFHLSSIIYHFFEQYPLKFTPFHKKNILFLDRPPKKTIPLSKKYKKWQF